MRGAVRAMNKAKRFLLLPLFLLAMATGLAAEDGAGVRWFAIPNVAYDTDDGLGFGARAELALDEAGYAPYKSAFVLHAFATTRGYHHHRLRYDRTGLGPGRRLRLTLHLAWRQWLNDGYWGLGNGTLRAPDASAKRYRYTLFQPFLHLTLRGRVDGPWSWFSSLNTKWSAVEAYAGSLLAEQRPFGMDGGLAAIASAGLLFDTRQPEVSPRRGVLLELSARGTPPLPAGAGAFGGPFLSARGFLSLTPWMVLAGRGMVEWLFGDVPFYELVHWGGWVPIAGFGGAETLRGISFGRWRAPGKAVINAELRIDLASHQAFGQPMVWQIVPYADAGVVFASEAATGPQGGLPLHPAAGVGVRCVYADAFVGRVDTGFGLDSVRAADGEVTHEASWGLYVVFDNAF